MHQQRAYVPVAIIDETLGVHRVHAFTTFLVRRGDAVDETVLGPGVGGRTFFGWARHDLELRNRGRALAVRGTEAVGARIAAADDDDVTAVHVDRGVLDVAELHPVGGRQVFHRLMDAREFPAGHRQIAPLGRAAGHHHRIARSPQLGDRDVVADPSVHPEACALRRHLREAAINMMLLHLEFGDPVAQQPADAVIALEHFHIVAGACELLRRCEPGRAGSDDGNALAGLL